MLDCSMKEKQQLQCSESAWNEGLVHFHFSEINMRLRCPVKRQATLVAIETGLSSSQARGSLQLKTPSTLNVFWMSSLDNRHNKLNMAKIRLLTFPSDHFPPCSPFYSKPGHSISYLLSPQTQIYLPPLQNLGIPHCPMDNVSCKLSSCLNYCGSFWNGSLFIL